MYAWCVKSIDFLFEFMKIDLFLRLFTRAWKAPFACAMHIENPNIRSNISSLWLPFYFWYKTTQPGDTWERLAWVTKIAESFSAGLDLWSLYFFRWCQQIWKNKLNFAISWLKKGLISMIVYSISIRDVHVKRYSLIMYEFSLSNVNPVRIF